MKYQSKYDFLINFHTKESTICEVADICTILAAQISFPATIGYSPVCNFYMSMSLIISLICHIQKNSLLLPLLTITICVLIGRKYPLHQKNDQT